MLNCKTYIILQAKINNLFSFFYRQIISVVGAVFCGWVVGFSTAKIRDLWKVVGATATGGICGGVAAVWG
jgi:hypothetical protein